MSDAKPYTDAEIEDWRVWASTQPLRRDRIYNERTVALDWLATVDALRAERDAYRKAKQENDERFMRERDEARAEVERLTAKVAAWVAVSDGLSDRFAVAAHERDEARAEVATERERVRVFEDLFSDVGRGLDYLDRVPWGQMIARRVRALDLAAAKEGGSDA